MTGQVREGEQRSTMGIVRRQVFAPDPNENVIVDPLQHRTNALRPEDVGCGIDEQHPTLPTKIALSHCDTDTDKVFPTHPRQAEVFRHFVGFRRNPDKHLKSYDSNFVPYSPTRPTSVPPQFRRIQRIKSPLNKYGKVRCDKIRKFHWSRRLPG
ncbi:hypothetical protein B0H34DRAFT_818215 [Crassisporium funariophilum]|nr:hypothetical protein B0H34DRAFT_818215 [Crassisporium funariophilum]